MSTSREPESRSRARCSVGVRLRKGVAASEPAPGAFLLGVALGDEAEDVVRFDVPAG
jgi:hypothetical protein